MKIVKDLNRLLGKHHWRFLGTGLIKRMTELKNPQHTIQLTPHYCSVLSSFCYNNISLDCCFIYSSKNFSASPKSLYDMRNVKKLAVTMASFFKSSSKNTRSVLNRIEGKRSMLRQKYCLVSHLTKNQKLQGSLFQQLQLTFMASRIFLFSSDPSTELVILLPQEHSLSQYFQKTVTENFLEDQSKSVFTTPAFLCCATLSAMQRLFPLMRLKKCWLFYFLSVPSQQMR